MKKVFMLTTMVLIGVLVVTTMLLGCGGAKPPEEKVIRVAQINPMTGPPAIIGVSSHKATQTWCEMVNAEGGIKADNTIYKLEAISYDDKGWLPTENLRAIRKAMFEDNAKLIMFSSNPAVTSACGPFVEENKDVAVCFNWGGTGISQNWPSLLGISTEWPEYVVGLYEYLAEVSPGPKKVVITGPDIPSYPSSVTWSKIGALAQDYEFIDAGVFPPDLSDAMPLMTRILEMEPDVIDADSATGSEILLMQAAYNLGFDGDWISISQTPVAALAAVSSPKYVERWIGRDPDWANDPNLPTEFGRKLYLKFEEMHGVDAWSPAAANPPNLAEVWKFGVEKAGTIEPEKVRQALLSTPEILCPRDGIGRWRGEEIYGVNHWLAAPDMVNTMVNGKMVTQGMIDITDWYDNNLDIIKQVFQEDGLGLWAK